MKYLESVVIVLILACFCGSAFSAEPTAETATEAKKAKDKDKKDAAPIKLEIKDEVAVTVNNKDIMESEVSKQVEMMMSQQFRGRQPQKDQVEMFTKMFRSQAINRLIIQMLLDKAINDSKIKVEDKDLDEKLEEMVQGVLKSNNLTREKLNEEITKSQGKSLKEVLADTKANPDFKRTVIVDKMVSAKFSDDLKVEEKEIKEYYEKNKKQYDKPELVRASHILIGTKEEKTEEAKKESLRKAKEILEKAKQKDGDFAALAKEHSTCPSGKNGGDLNFFPRQGAMVEPFAAAAFKLQKDEICPEVVETKFGYHIIKVTDRTPAKTIQFEEAKDQILANLEGRKKQELTKKFIDNIRNEAKIVYPEGKEPKEPKAKGMTLPKGAKNKPKSAK